MNTKDWTDAIEAFYDALSSSTDEYVYIGDLSTGTFRYPRQLVEEFGLPGEIVKDAAGFWSGLVHEKDREIFLEANRDIAEGRTTSHNVEYRARNTDGRWIWLRCRGRVEPDSEGNYVLFAGTITDLSRTAKTDHVTGLLSRFEAEKRVNRIISYNPEQRVGILLLGLDDFRHINDLHDRQFGDEVIRQMAQELVNILPDCAAAYRFDGDEYVVIFRDAPAAEIYNFYSRVKKLCEIPRECRDKIYYVTMSGGYAEYPVHGKNYQELVKRAVYSLEYSKMAGKNRLTIFSREVMAGRERSLELTEILRRSVENDFEGFELYYQPLYSADSKRINGAEALARFSCQELGAVSPAEFIPLLESSGLIQKTGRWIFETAVLSAKRFQKTNPGFTMHINVSWVQLEGGDFLPYLVNKKREGFLENTKIVLELTETCISSNYDKVRGVLHILHDLGFKVAMDDFGTGYSSLGLLKAVPVNIVKIDQSFISSMKDSVFDSTFIEFIVKLCHTMDISVCQEGIETREQAEELEDKQLDVFQGYLFGRPMPEEQFQKLLGREETGYEV